MHCSKELSDFLWENGLKPDDTKEDRGAAIHLAISQRSSNIAKELLKLYPEDCISVKDYKGRKKGRVPLHNAAQLGMRSLVVDLLDKGADINAITGAGWGWSALMLAVEAGQREVVAILLQRGADLEVQTRDDVKSDNRKRWTALHLAAAELKSPNIILQLLHKGANCNAKTLDGDTALHLAVRFQCLTAAGLLLLHGASSRAKNNLGISPEDIMIKFQKDDRHKFQHMLKCNTADAKPQFLSCIDGDLVNPNLPKAMHKAAEKGMVGALIYLLHMDHRLVLAKNESGWQPLHTATKFGSTEAARTLLKHGADVNCLTKGKWTPVMLASKYNHIEVLKVLLLYKPNTMLQSSDGYDAATLASRHGDTLVNLLPTFRHVPRNMVPRAEKNSQKNSPESSNSMLHVPKRPGPSRDPSPARSDSSELEGELYALSDATTATSSDSSPKNSGTIEKLFQDLERTWYERIQWSPEDDNNKSSPEWSGPVKIAILDTGIDLGHEDFRLPPRRHTKIGQRVASKLAERPQRDRIKACRNFIGGPGEEEDVQDTVGHGTHIAGIILAIAPRAELYIAKTSSSESLSTSAHSDSKSDKTRRKGRRPVEEALQWAIDQGVDIINLSLGFPYESSYDLTQALEDANHKGIIVFAAAANHGNREAISWPARDRDLAICVTSGDEQNTLSRFAPSGNRDLPVFITHGEDVCSQWPTNLGGGYRKMSGTSVSTPVAVGMAAMVLAFLNTTNHWSLGQKREWLDRSKERRLRSTRGMGRLLEQICRDRNGLKVLSPKLMWEENPNANPLQILSAISQAFRLPG